MVDLNLHHGGYAHLLSEITGNRIIDFSANINPLTSKTKLKKIINSSIEKISYYPDPQYRTLIKKISDFWNIPQNCILLGNGSVELFYLITTLLKPKRTLINIPTFSEYEFAAKIPNSKIIFRSILENKNLKIPNKNLNVDLEFICNPNNPTGNLLPVKEYYLSRKNGILVVDEAFMDFVIDEVKHTLINDAVKNKNLIVVRTFTKIYSIPGLRLGYLIAHKDIITKLKRKTAPWNINILAQIIAEKMLEEKLFILNTKKYFCKEREYLYNVLSKINSIKAYQSVANFILLKIINEKYTSIDLKNKFLEKGILIRDCSNFRGLDNKHFRIAIKKRNENNLFLKLLNEIL